MGQFIKKTALIETLANVASSMLNRSRKSSFVWRWDKCYTTFLIFQSMNRDLLLTMKHIYLIGREKVRKINV